MEKKLNDSLLKIISSLSKTNEKMSDVAIKSLTELEKKKKEFQKERTKINKEINSGSRRSSGKLPV